jgi:hypothetical protein
LNVNWPGNEKHLFLYAVQISQPLERQQEHGSQLGWLPEGLGFAWRITFIRDRSERRAKINVRESLTLDGSVGIKF